MYYMYVNVCYLSYINIIVSVWSCVAEVKFVLLNQLKKGTNNNVIKTIEHEYKYSYNGNNSVGIELLKWEVCSTVYLLFVFVVYNIYYKMSLKLRMVL